MKKTVTKIIAAVCLLVSMFSLTACSDELAMGKEYISYKSQLDALNQLKAGSIDAAVIDSVMANYYTTTGELAGEIEIVDNLVFAEEEYGIAAKKGNAALISKINQALIATKDGSFKTLAETYGLDGEIAITSETVDTYANATDSSWTDVVESNKIVIGYTVFAPIAFEHNGVLTGFDIELARNVVEHLNAALNVSLEAEFVEIEWDAKEALLANGSIDLVWNGLTITPERSENMCISVPYLKNRQVAVVKMGDADKYSDKDSFDSAVMGAEAGSAGESIIKGN